jgi:hypothetical protein
MAIRDQGYKPYEGDLVGGPSPIWTVAVTHLGLYWSLLRTKLLFIFLMIVPVMYLVLSFAEQVFSKMFGQGGDGGKISGLYEYSFGYLEIWMLALMLAASGCGVVADDMRYRTIQLYFSKPLQKFEYILGKFFSLVMLGSLVTWLPFLLVGVVRVLIYLPKDNLTEVLWNLGALGLFNLALVGVFSLMVMALSCLTTRTGYVVLAWLGSLLVPSVIATIVGLVRRGEEWPQLLSVVGNLDVALKRLVGYEGLPLPGQLAADAPPEYTLWVPWLVLAALVGGALAIINWRTSRLEGIA